MQTFPKHKVYTSHIPKFTKKPSIYKHEEGIFYKKNYLIRNFLCKFVADFVKTRIIIKNNNK